MTARSMVRIATWSAEPVLISSHERQPLLKSTISGISASRRTRCVQLEYRRRNDVGCQCIRRLGPRLHRPGRQPRKMSPSTGRIKSRPIGDLAKINRQFNQEAVVTTTWTISSDCTTFEECTGTVHSAQGWTAPMYMHDGLMWYVKRERARLGKVPGRYRIHRAAGILFLSGGPDGKRCVLGSPTWPERTRRSVRAAPAGKTNGLPSRCRYGWTRSADSGSPCFEPQVGSMSCHVLGAVEVARSDCWYNFPSGPT